MEISDMQSKVSDFVEENQLETEVEIRLLDLMSELGELSKESLKSTQ